MPRTITLTGLMIDSWRDQPQTEPGESNLPGDAIPTSHFRGTSGDVPSALRLTSLTGLIALAATKWEPR